MLKHKEKYPPPPKKTHTQEAELEDGVTEAYEALALSFDHNSREEREQVRTRCGLAWFDV